MPERRLGFGHDAVLNLISLIRDYSEKFPQNDQILHAISVLDAYREMHRKENFSLRPDLQQALDSLLADFPPAVKEDGQIEMTREQYYAHLESSFPEFSASRHSVRHFNGPVSLEQIEQAVSLARNAPSACNRQHARVHCICDKETRKKCFPSRMETGDSVIWLISCSLLPRISTTSAGRKKGTTCTLTQASF